jgi:hypothetical protein
MRWAVLAFAACSSQNAAHPDALSDALADASVADGAPDAEQVCPGVTSIATGTASEVAIANDAPAAGIFDPSIVYPAGAAGGAMAYSAVPDQMTIETHVAVSSDDGATWTEVAQANAPEAATISSSDANECPGGACSGNLISEVSSLIYDATDPDPQKRWKLFAHRYLIGPGTTLHYRIGTITLQTAPGPDGPWTTPAKWIGWNSPAAYTSTGVATNANALAGTSDCLALTEPGALVLPASIELAVGCIYLDAGAPKIRIELLRSADHAASWQSVGTLLRADDSECGATGASINAADLFASGGTEYVIASPSDSSGYHGCLVFPIADIAAGKIRRDASGRALPSRDLAPSPSQFSGACTFADGAGGYTMPVGYLGTSRPFRIFRTGVTVP